MRTEGALLLLPRVGEGDGNTDALALALDAEGDDAERFAAGAPLPPDLGEGGAGLEAAPRLTGVLRGDTADRREVCLPVSGLFLAVAARRVEGRVRSDGDAREEAPPPLPLPPLAVALPPAASRACLMTLNCRLIFAAWDFVSV